MPDKHLFEYAVIRVMPRVERGEFLNVGVILYCSAQGFLKTLYHLSEERLLILNPALDLAELHERLHSFEQICTGRPDGGTLGELPIAARFRWLTAARSTVVQTSPVHPGLCTNATETLTRLFEQLVL